jgi:hypothetical protein
MLPELSGSPIVKVMIPPDIVPGELATNEVA